MSNNRRRLRLHLEATFTTPLNIGGHGAPVFVDRPFRRDREGWPFIPSSTLKGRLRHESQRLARALEAQVCKGPRPEDLCPMAFRDTHAHYVCPICRIFGSPWIEGRLYPMDLVLERPEELETYRYPPPSEVRYHVSISRQRQVAEDARLFTTELFLPGIPLKFNAVWEGDLSWGDLVLLEAGLGAITALGREKTSGLGWCTFLVKSEALSRAGEWRAITKEERNTGCMEWAKSGGDNDTD